MFKYNFSLALRSLREKPGLTLLMVMAMAIGLGMYVTFYTIAVNGADVPHGRQAERLHLVQLDNREPSADKIDRAIRMPDTTYRDMINLLGTDMPAERQTAVFRTYGTLSLDDPNIRPIQTRGAATTHDFFTMFDAPFLYGTHWDNATDAQGAGMIVISNKMNERLFGGVNSVGKSLMLDNQPMTIVGVLDNWFLSWRIYDRGYMQGYPHDYFVPVQYGLSQNLLRDVNFDCWSTEEQISRTFNSENLPELQASECGWLAFWAEFAPEQRAEYQAKLDIYIQQQKAFGRFPREQVDIFLLNINEQVDYLDTNYGGANRVLMAQLFFAVCLLNAVGILLAKFVRRAKEVSLRRALGARKSAIISQHIMEVGIIGCISGVLGIGIGWLGLQGMIQVRLYSNDYRARLEDILPYHALDWSLVLYAFSVSIVCALIVSIYPIWRLCSQPSAALLRSQ